MWSCTCMRPKITFQEFKLFYLFLWKSCGGAESMLMKKVWRKSLFVSLINISFLPLWNVELHFSLILFYSSQLSVYYSGQSILSKNWTIPGLFFLYFRLYTTICADDCILTRYLWWWKRQLYQLCAKTTALSITSFFIMLKPFMPM